MSATPAVLPEAGSELSTPHWKRILDLLLLLAALPMVLFLGLVFAAYIKAVSPGPVFFRQTRIGRGGKPFLCFKFRTMKPNSSTAGHEQHLAGLINSNAPMTKLDRFGDNRVIPGGAILRSTGLDELPQLWNVLKGEMSIVGPRPCLPYEFALYNETQKGRVAVVPGITGLWQVTGKNRTTFQEMINLDLAYVKSRSLVLDLSILARTVGVLLRQFGDCVFKPADLAVPAKPVQLQE
jgi:lipopolysaccharide/colanic/teichoic acid biosynthesis glycosyltransferase